jgi:hypothetical protein
MTHVLGNTQSFVVKWSAICEELIIFALARPPMRSHAPRRYSPRHPDGDFEVHRPPPARRICEQFVTTHNPHGLASSLDIVACDTL